MSETPRSEKLQTRFSTPVSDLDDHRHQPASLPRVETGGSGPGTRRGTFASIHAPPERPSLLLQVNEALERHEFTSRNLENAVADDDRSAHGSHLVHDMYGRRGSLAPGSPAGGRRDTFRRPRDPAVERLSRSRTSSNSSRSVSPPNSVDAFADPRRRGRAGTVNSRPPSELELAIHRTISGGTRRRPTISDERPENLDPEIASGHSSAEEDVCFPVQEDPGKSTKFDYEELEEFVAEFHEKTPIAQPLRHKTSVASHLAKPKVFNDLRPKTSNSTAPRPDVDVATLKGGADPDLEEKLAEGGLSHILNGEKSGSVNDVTLNRWTFFSSELDDTIHAAELGGLLMPGERFRDLFELSPDGGVWWLDMVNPTEEEVFAICKAFGVHPLTREDITTQETREKVELFHSYYFVCFRSFYQMDKTSENYLEPVNFYAVVFKEGLLTFTFVESPHAANVRKRIGRLRDYVSLSADWICYALIDDIVDAFAPVLRSIEVETDGIEDQVFTARIEDSRSILRAIGDCRKKVMSLLRLLGGKADVIKGFAKRCNENYGVAPRGDVGLYLSDIQDHVVTMMSNLGHCEKMLSRSHSNYLAQISVDQVIQGNQSNITLGKVTVIATILVPLNLICGLFGMNVHVPGQDSGSLAWFFGILGSIFLFVTLCLCTAKKLRRSSLKVQHINSPPTSVLASPVLFVLHQQRTMAVPRSRVLDLMKVQCHIFNTTFNPNRLRLGTKILHERLKGPSVASYYPPRIGTVKQLRRLYPEYEIWDDKEQDWLEHMQIARSRGKAPPKKKRTAAGKWGWIDAR
ncbi:cora-domain-containing protein [Zopfia rhizophila CBS 207.26]|uniref:Cora-domain-containing protein n=1 Tax=Zopfia rhizophila CBS 207.26 TaxID=1314779 RepID=A0A6A6DUM0_9PEZI|nr:cora-domain-containing protein [Zopfia rhizophila CBS 207.26]